MKFDSEKFHRRSVRLPGFDYSQAGFYFITICTDGRKCLFGKIENEKMVLNGLGKIVRDELIETEIIRPNVWIDCFVIMPNHLHIILIIKNKINIGRGVLQYAPTTKLTSPSQTVGSIIRGIKSTTTKQINIRRGYVASVWQRNYFEHIIRNENDYNAICRYIILNPAIWDRDRNNPDFVKF